MIRKAFKMIVYPTVLTSTPIATTPSGRNWPPPYASTAPPIAAFSATWETSNLFGYVEVRDEDLWTDVKDSEVCQKWWAYTKDVMETDPGNSAVITDLLEVFHLD